MADELIDAQPMPAVHKVFAELGELGPKGIAQRAREARVEGTRRRPRSCLIARLVLELTGEVIGVSQSNWYDAQAIYQGGLPPSVSLFIYLFDNLQFPDLIDD